MRTLNRLKSEIDSLPPVAAWLATGPEPTKQAVISAKRKMLLVQAPIALGSIAIFSTLHSFGLVETKGHAQIVSHFFAATAFMWPPTLFSVCFTAKRDAKASHGPIKNQLRLLALASGTVAAFSTIALAGVAILYARAILQM